MLLPVAQKTGKLLDRCASEQVRTELVEGLGNTYGFGMARKELMEGWRIRVLYHMALYHMRQAMPRPTGGDGIHRGLRVTYYLRMGHGTKWGELGGCT